MVRTIIVEDSAIIRDYLVAMLQKDDRFEIAAALDDAFAAEKLCKDEDIDLVLMDVLTASNHSGLAAGERIRTQSSGRTKVIIVTSLLDPDILARGKSGAADSLWYKDHGEGGLMDVIDATLSGESVFPDKSPSVPLNNFFSEDISPRQMSILRCFVMGMTYAEIAEKLGLTSRGVRWNMDQIVSKGGFSNKHEMLAAILSNKLIVTTLKDKEME